MTPNLAAQNRGFVWVHMVPLLTFSTALLQAAAPGPHPVSSTAQSHIPNQTFTHPRWRLRVTRSSCGSERSFCSQALLSSQPDGWRGGIRGQEGDSRVGLESSIQLPDVELPDLHEGKGPDPLKCTIENMLMINQGKNCLRSVSFNLSFPGKTWVMCHICAGVWKPAYYGTGWLIAGVSLC